MIFLLTQKCYQLLLGFLRFLRGFFKKSLDLRVGRLLGVRLHFLVSGFVGADQMAKILKFNLI
jgi:hypothetical protein